MPAARPVVIGAAVVVLLCGAALAVPVLTGDGVPPGVSVAEIAVSGLSPERAEAEIARGLAQAVTAPVTLSAAGEVLALDPRAAGLAVDVPATARRAASAGPLDRLAALVGVEREVAPVVVVDEPALSAAVAELARGLDRPAREGAITFDEAGAPVPVLPEPGRTLEVPAAVDAVRNGWLRDDGGPLDLPVEVAPVRATTEQVTAALEQVARPAVAAPVVVDVQGDRLEVEPLDIAAALRLEPDESGVLQPLLDEAVLYEQVRTRLRSVGDPPVDATFDVSSGTPVVVPARIGRSVSAADLAAAVLGVLDDPAPRTASAPLSTVPARITTEQAGTLGVVEQIGTFTTRHPCCAPRVQNIHRIADLVDDHVLLPGDTFDLNEFVGPRDKAGGFVAAPQILDGEFVEGVGGGISQFATSLYNAVFFSGLEDVVHVPHSYYISRYPPGREATISFPLPDLVFRNDSPHGVLLDTAYTGTSITVTFWGTKRFDEVRSVTGPRTRVRQPETRYLQTPGCSPSSGSQGFDIVVTRILVAGGLEVGREDDRTRYLAQPRTICGVPPVPAPAPSPAPSPSPAPPAPPGPSSPPVPPAPAG